jgi:hypothetical protein
MGQLCRLAGSLPLPNPGQSMNAESPIMPVKSWRRDKDAVFG